MPHPGQRTRLGAHAAISFNLDGAITHANDDFLATLGYSLDEILDNIYRMLPADGYLPRR